MRIGCSTVCLHDHSWRACFAEVATAGFANLELLMVPGWKHLEPGQVPAAEVRAEADRHGLRLTALHAGGLDGLTDGSVADSVAYIRRVMDFATEVGVSLVNVNGGMTPPGADAAARHGMLGRIGLALRSLLPDLDRRDLRLTLENHYGFQLQIPDDYRTLLQFVSDETGFRRVGVTVDTGHFAAAGVDIPAFVREIGPHL